MDQSDESARSDLVFELQHETFQVTLIALTFVGGCLSWRLYRPRRIGTYEAKIVQRVLQMDADAVPSSTLLASIGNLIVHEEGGGDFQYDSLEFITSLDDHGSCIASAIGAMANDALIELVVWARGDTITRLELESFNGTRLPIRMPILETIGPYPADEYSSDEEG